MNRNIFVKIMTLLMTLPLCGADSHAETVNQLMARLSALEQQALISQKESENRQQWRQVQEKVQDTVVQIFAQFIEIDLLHPYKAPAQFPTFGSGFFIDDQGHIITNAHAVEQAVAVWIQIPSLGKRIIKVDVIGMCPERDLALLKVCDEDLAYIREQRGTCPYLKLGDSDLVHRADEVMALGYPLAQQSLKSTTGVISGREQQFIQMSAAINPGSSGGPLLNIKGEVIGINSRGYTEAQNVGYIIPINDLKIIIADLHTHRVLGKPFLGVSMASANEQLTAYLGNPAPGGCYVVGVIKNSLMHEVGVQKGDMIYEINGYALDFYGDMKLPWSEDKISIIDYIAQLRTNDDIQLVVYRKGERKEFVLKFSHMVKMPIRKIYPVYETTEYEIIGGMVVMPLTLNHVTQLLGQAPGLSVYTVSAHQIEPALLITHVFPTSQLSRGRVVMPGMIIKSVNDESVKTLEEFTAAVKKSIGTQYLTMHVIDNSSLAAHDILIVLSYKQLLAEEPRLARDFRYPMSDLAKELIQLAASKSNELEAE